MTAQAALPLRKWTLSKQSQCTLPCSDSYWRSDLSGCLSAFTCFRPLQAEVPHLLKWPWWSWKCSLPFVFRAACCSSSEPTPSLFPVPDASACSHAERSSLLRRARNMFVPRSCTVPEHWGMPAPGWTSSQTWAGPKWKPSLEKRRGTETKSKSQRAFSRIMGQCTMKWRCLRTGSAKNHNTHYVEVFLVWRLGKGWEQSFEGWRNHGFKYRIPWRRERNKVLSSPQTLQPPAPRATHAAPLCLKDLFFLRTSSHWGHQRWGFCTPPEPPGHGPSGRCEVYIWSAPYKTETFPGEMPLMLKAATMRGYQRVSPEQQLLNQTSRRRRGRGRLRLWVQACWPRWNAPSWRLSLQPQGHGAVQQGKPPQVSTMAAARHHLDGGAGGVRGVILDLSI